MSARSSTSLRDVNFEVKGEKKPAPRKVVKSSWDYQIRGFRKKKFPLRTGLAAIALFATGIILILTGVNVGRFEKDRGLALIILGSLAFLPGLYASYMLYGAWKGWRGFDYSQVPSYDD